jgi:hypothetical protein
VVDSPDRSDDAAWGDVEQAFFASAPPDVPDPPAEPARFDDLDPAVPVGRESPLRRAVVATAAKAASFRRAILDAGRRTGQPVAAAGRRGARLAVAASRRSARALAAAGAATSREVQAGLARLGAALSGLPLGRRQGVAVAFASVIVVMGLSAGVVASRSGARSSSPMALAMPTAPAAMRVATPATPTTVATPTPATPTPATPTPATPMPATPMPATPTLPAPTPVTPTAATVVASAPAVEAAPSPAAPEQPAEVPAELRPPHPQASKRPARHHRKLAWAPDSRRDLIVPAFMQAPASQPSRPSQPAPVPASRPLFSR